MLAVLACMLEDVPQMSIGLWYLMVKTSEHGIDCVADFVREPTDLHLLTLDRSVDNIFGLLWKNPVVGMVVLTALFNSSAVGYMMIHVAIHNTGKTLCEVISVIMKSICILVFIIIIMTPYSWALYQHGADFFMIESLKEYSKIFFFVGTVLWSGFCLVSCCGCIFSGGVCEDCDFCCGCDCCEGWCNGECCCCC